MPKQKDLNEKDGVKLYVKQITHYLNLFILAEMHSSEVEELVGYEVDLKRNQINKLPLGVTMYCLEQMSGIH